MQCFCRCECSTLADIKYAGYLEMRLCLCFKMTHLLSFLSDLPTSGPSCGDDYTCWQPVFSYSKGTGNILAPSLFEKQGEKKDQMRNKRKLKALVLDGIPDSATQSPD